MTAEFTDGGRGYPARLEIDYPEEGLSRLTTFFRAIWIIPILAVMAALGGGLPNASGLRDAVANAGPVGGVLFLPALLMILFRRKYPRWWFDWQLELARFTQRVFAYLLLMRDEYPSTDEEQAVHLELDYPDAERDLNRWLPLVKWLLAIPHFVILFALGTIVAVLVAVAWFAILFTGRFPRGMFRFVLGVLRWTLRVQAYALLLTTDRYPPFSFDDN